MDSFVQISMQGRYTYTVLENGDVYRYDAHDNKWMLLRPVPNIMIDPATADCEIDVARFE